MDIINNLISNDGMAKLGLLERSRQVKLGNGERRNQVQS